MKYCGNEVCPNPLWCYTDEEGTYCKDCGTALTPYLRCLCGQAAFHPRLTQQFCPKCGTALTAAYLGKCMSQQLAGMVKEIVAQKAGLPLTAVVQLKDS